jgi:hypothetical protein
MSKPQGPVYKSPVASDIPFDPTVDPSCGLIGENVEDVVYELCSQSSVAASPGYQFGREGIHNAGTWLIGAETMSNKRGLPFGLINGSIRKVTISTENIALAFTVKVYHHTGNLSGLTLLGSVTTTGTVDTEDFSVNWVVPYKKQLSVEISAVGVGSGRPKETGVFLLTKGDLT